MKRNLSIVILSFLNVLKSLVLVLAAYFSKVLIDCATKQESCTKAIIVFTTCIISGLILYVVYAFIKNRFSLNVEIEYKRKVFDKILKSDVIELQKYHSGEITNLCLNDIAYIKNGICSLIPDVCLYASRFIFALTFLIIFDYRLLLLLLVFGFICMAGAFIYSHWMKKYQKKAMESDGKLNSFMQEGQQNIRYIDAMNAQEQVRKQEDVLLDENHKIKNKRNTISVIGNSGLFVLVRVSYALTILYGAYRLFNDVAFYGTLMALVQIVSYLESPLSMVSSLFNQYAGYKVSKKRMEDFLSIPEEKQQISLSDFDKIVFENVTFGYQKPIFKHFNFEIQKGDTWILKGPSGKGKTTLFMLLLGFLKPQEGRIVVYKGEKCYPVEQCRTLFSYVPQENILFSGSIEDNFKFFLEDITKEQMKEALSLVDMEEELLAQHRGIHSKLHERGEGLSLGQIQRILLSIAYLKNNPILLLDEFTSSLDKNLEGKIVERVGKLNKTKIVITHREIQIPGAKVLDLGEVDHE